MAFFIGLLAFTLAVWGISKLIGRGVFQNFKTSARLATTIMFVQVGMIHLINPSALTYMIEGFLPYPKLLVIVSGISEIILGLGLWWERTRKISAWILMIQLVMMFPANINVAVNNLSAPGGLPSEAWYTWSRLAFQPLYILWIYWTSMYSGSKQNTTS
ncbi:MAG: hypothetical protein RLO17_04455 [Cyclobacteriaceae bacterium]